MRKVILTLIISHGITDLFLPFQLWQPVYLLSLLLIFLPLEYINIITLLLSSIHFSSDLDFYNNIHFINYINLISNINVNNNSIYFIRIYQTLLLLMILVYFGKHKISQNIIIGYMALIHTPIHLYHTIDTLSKLEIYIIFSIIIYNFNYIHNLINTIIRSVSSSPNNIEHKLILSIINAHIIVNSDFINSDFINSDFVNSDFITL